MNTFKASFFHDIHLQQSGFTLVEFIVIMSIFAIMVGVVLFNFTSFRSRVTLDNLAHDIALSIRQVQTSAGASGTIGTPEQEEYRGIAFKKGTNGFEKDFVFYKSGSSDNWSFDGTDGNIIDTISIKTPDKITTITTGDTLDQARSDDAVQVDSDYISIAFKRFRTEAFFSPDTVTQQYMCIHIESPDGNDVEKRAVCVSKIGQVSVQ
jgi:Tfp pilus assembly protein FimT